MRQVTAQMEEGNLIYRGKFNLCVLAVNGDGTPFYFERVLEFQYGREWSRSMEDLRCQTAPYLWRISAIALPELPALRSKQTKLEATLYQQNMYKMISDLIPNEDQPKSKDSEAALILYYAEAGKNCGGLPILLYLHSANESKQKMIWWRMW